MNLSLHTLVNSILLFFTECGGVFNATSGSIKSPNYPGVYPNNAKCDYKIVVPFGHTLNIMLEQIDVELDSNCEFDSLKIFDGDTSKAYKLGEFFQACYPETRKQI